MSRARLRLKSVAIPYDTSVGNGVDSSGFADLPLRGGAKRFFVSATTGNDTRTITQAQDPTTPLASVAAATAFVTNGAGDQILIAEGTSYSAGVPSLNNCAGFSALYPFVIQSYDATDALNAAKYGRASSGRPVLNTGASQQDVTGSATTPASYLAIRGFDFNPGTAPDMLVNFIASNFLANSYVLVENNLFRSTEIAVNQSPSTLKGEHFVFRNNSVTGAWSSTAHMQGIYLSGLSSFTVEDNVFYHCGWKIGASRDDTTANGGTTEFRHSVYQQDDADGIVRRNLFIDPSATGGSLRGNVNCQQNVFLDCPIAIIGGKGDNYNTIRPTGVDITIAYNAILGDADINTANARGQAILNGNGRNGNTAIHHNLIARSRDVNGVNVHAFMTEAEFAQPSYALFDSNVAYLWASAAQTTETGGAVPAQCFPTYTNNKWDAAASGSNVNSGGVGFPNAYTAAQFYTALGYANKQALIDYVTVHPETRPSRQALSLLQTGYGIS